MGFLSGMKAANNAWGQVTGNFINGVGTIGPENMVDNRSHRLLISVGFSNPIVFTAKDLSSVDLICATSEWVKYKINFLDGRVAIATFMALSLEPNGPKKKGLGLGSGGVSTGKKFSMGLLNFEWWLADVIYKNTKFNCNTDQENVVNIESGSKPVNIQSGDVSKINLSTNKTSTLGTNNSKSSYNYSAKTGQKQWTCSKCGEVNRIEAKNCIGCFNPRPF